MGRPKGGTNISHSKEEKLLLVLRNLKGESIVSLSRETGIYTLNRYDKQRQELDYYVLDIHSHYPSHGYRTIADTLINMYGWVVSDISVWKSMKRLGISGYVRKQKYPETEGSEHNRYANKLNREFPAEKPMEKLKKPPVQYRLEQAA